GQDLILGQAAVLVEGHPVRLESVLAAHGLSEKVCRKVEQRTFGWIELVGALVPVDPKADGTQCGVKPQVWRDLNHAHIGHSQGEERVPVPKTWPDENIPPEPAQKLPEEPVAGLSEGQLRPFPGEDPQAVDVVIQTSMSVTGRGLV